MYNLTAQVTSSLLPFPGVTTDALGEDEITLDSVLHGRFTIGKQIFLTNDLVKFVCSILSCDDRSVFTQCALTLLFLLHIGFIYLFLSGSFTDSEGILDDSSIMKIINSNELNTNL